MARVRVVNEVHVKPIVKLAGGVVDGLRVDQRLKLLRQSGLDIQKRVKPKLKTVLKGDPGYKEREKSKSAKKRARRKARLKAQSKHKHVKPAILDGLDRNKENYAERLVALNRLGFKTYDEYRVSELWYGIRKKVIGSKGSRCSLCPNSYDCIHHHSYRRDVLSGKNIQPLFPLCNGCHERIEFADGRKRQLSEVQKVFRKLMQEKHGKPG